MNIIDYAKGILFSADIESKLLDPKVVTDFKGQILDEKLSLVVPTREKKIIFTPDQIKFPKKSSLHLDEKKGLALHFFANHELMAIEMMAAAILYLPVEESFAVKIRKSLLTTIKDEQKHFKMYVNRMRDFGIDFGDFSINDYFWRQMQKCKNLTEYFSVVALTFESANLDFAKYYSEVFKSYDDKETSKIMDIVYQEEISHVALGAYWLNQWRGDIKLWEYYRNSLPELMTPARAKGLNFDDEGRKKAGLDDEFIRAIKEYRDDFKITKRKEWD